MENTIKSDLIQINRDELEFLVHQVQEYQELKELLKSEVEV